MELSNQSITSLRKQLTSGDICSADIIGSLADAIEKKDVKLAPTFHMTLTPQGRQQKPLTSAYHWAVFL